MQACDRCHARKTRCDRRLPSCTACERARVACLHRDKLRQRNIPRGYVDGIENQLQILSAENTRLQTELSALRDARTVEGSISPQNASTLATTEDSLGQNHSDDSTALPADRRTVQHPNGLHSFEHRISKNMSTMSEDAVSTEVGYLSLKATGETRYVGSSSGIGLASIISNMVDQATAVSLMPTQGLDFGLNKPSDAIEPSPDIPVPSRAAAAPFIEAYFQHTHVTFPLLHRPSFLESVDAIYGNPDYYNAHADVAFVFDMVLSIGSSNFNHFGDASACSQGHYSRARANIPAVLGMPGLMPLQAIILLSQYGIFSNLRDTSASIWHLIGIGVRICYETGLHVEPRRHSTFHGEQAMPVTFHEEMKRRCFWCLYNLDRVVSFTLGRPAAIKDEDIDISLPSPLDDSEFGPDAALDIHLSIVRKTSPFLHVIAIRRLSGEILAAFYRPNHGQCSSYDEKKALRQVLHEKVVAWREETQLLTLSASATSLFKSCFLSPDWYTAVYNNAMLLLYRPSPAFPHPTNSASRNEPDGDLAHLYSAAKNTIHAYAALHRRRRLNYSWITLHGVFVAGLAYVYCVGRALKDATSTMPVPEYLEIINDTRACSNMLVAICERWNSVRRSCELFNSLSNAVIRDAVNVSVRVSNEAMSGQHARTALDDNLQRGGGNTTESRGHTNGLDMIPLMDQFFVADEFRQYAEAFDTSIPGAQSFPSELITGFSQDWSFDDDFGQEQNFGINMQHSHSAWSSG